MSISALLSELIKSSIGIRAPYAPDSREARIMRLILDELSLLPALPLQLPQPADRRIGTICSTLQNDPGDGSTLADWSERLNLDEKTIQRLFRKETGMTFGRWRQQARLLLALERIAVGERIIDVAGALGSTARVRSPPCSRNSSARRRASSSDEVPPGDLQEPACWRATARR